MNSLTKISRARQELQEAKDLDDILSIRDKAEAIRVYTKAVNESLEAQNHAAEIKLRAERKAGELLAGMEKSKGGRPTETTTTMVGVSPLEDFGISHNQSSRWQKEATVSDAEFDALVAECNEEGRELTQASVLRLASPAHVSNATGDNEWYTPAEYLNLACEVMGGIDLDPASSDVAQETVRAEHYFTIDDDGLAQEWFGRVWLNPPYSRDLIGAFTAKLVASLGEVSEAILLVNNSTDTEWFQYVSGHAAAICLVEGRIRFLDPEGNRSGSSPLQGQVVLYFGENDLLFAEHFSSVGTVFISNS